MHLQDAEHWLRKAAQARHTAEKMSGDDAKSVMLELAAHYEKLAHNARMIAAILGVPEDSSS